MARHEGAGIVLRVAGDAHDAAMTAAQSARFSEALAEAVKKKIPEAKTYKLKRGSISTDAELQTWLDETGQEVREQLKQGPVILD